MNTFKQISVLCLIVLPVIVFAQPYAEGPKKCKECHEAEYDVWKGSEHFKAYKAVQKKPEAKEILKAVGTGKSMKKNKVCATCHFTMFKKSADKPTKAKAGPSCESCHGPSSGYLETHNDYGGKNAKAADETPVHKEQRHADAIKAGMIWSFMHYDIAMNCMSCHGLARSDIDAEVFGKLMAAKHPANDKFEFVEYSQGSVRHRYYPPDETKNAKMSNSELARLFIIGQVAKLVSAYAAEKVGTDDAYKAFQKKRADDARTSLSVLTNIPEVQALLDAPSDGAARKLADAIKDKDLSAEVGSMLPTTYK